MATPLEPDRDDEADEFAREAAKRPRGVLREWVDLLAHNKKWWLTPIVVMLLILGVLIALGGTAAAPFIYTIF